MCHFKNVSSRRDPYTHGFSAPQPGYGRFMKHFGGWQGAAARVPVNVRESKDWYEIFVYAPGLSKNAFEVAVSDDVLSIRFQADEQANAQGQWLHQEYPNGSFERQFLLNGKIDTASIAARYTDGVLELTLPKLPGAAAQNIAVA